ncbi:hypothetical protein BHE74_00036592 [Ensete ventricosum]|nr:hypothetical protein BHE74_00036592 [Ensete ventricosum]
MLFRGPDKTGRFLTSVSSRCPPLPLVFPYRHSSVARLWRRPPVCVEDPNNFCPLSLFLLWGSRMASIPSVSFASLCRQAAERRPTLAVAGASFALGGFRAGVPSLSSRMVVRCVAAASWYSDSEDRDAIFNTYIQALKEDPDQYSNKVNQIRPLRRKTYKLPGPDWIALANTRSLTAISVEVNAAFL